MAYHYATWTSDLKTGNTIIDNQHKQLIAAVNALFKAQKDGTGRQEVENTMKLLVEYTKKHFADEEKLQELHGYPDYPAHKQYHADFKNVARKLIDTLHQDGPTGEFISDACSTIGRWVVNHIKTEDCKIAAHIQSKILKNV